MRASRTTRRGFLAQGAGRLPVLLFQRKGRYVRYGFVSWGRKEGRHFEHGTFFEEKMLHAGRIFREKSVRSARFSCHPLSVLIRKTCARVAKLVYARDLKSLVRKDLRVQAPHRVPKDVQEGLMLFFRSMGRFLLLERRFPYCCVLLPGNRRDILLPAWEQSPKLCACRLCGVSSIASGSRKRLRRRLYFGSGKMEERPGDGTDFPAETSLSAAWGQPLV